MTSVVTSGRHHGFATGDIAQLSSGWVLVLEANETVVVVRPYRWYECAWDWMKQSARHVGRLTLGR